MEVPPNVDPLDGDTLDTVGAVSTYSNKLFASFVPLGVVTNTLAEPATLASVVAVIVVESTTVNSVTAIPPIVTSVVPVKFAPVIVMEVPPNVDPLEGETLDTVGEVSTYSNKLFASFVPLGVVTNTLAEPATLASVVALMVVEFTTVNSVTAIPPIVTSVVPVKFAPVIAIEVPPNVEPLEGETLDTVGEVSTYSNKLFALFVPLEVVTNTLAEPENFASVVAVMVVGFTTVNSVTATPPIVTAVVPVKFAPVIVMEVPPNVDPLEGETLDTVGAGAT